ncbi:Retrovirus-related Pol polyprotein from transposon RE2 [Vitis vinifera]|uniref:Retrovirus-related Pol polyprotein from transposon RE2 n=1 Tax=Vitis vinifera TaxID=29760 RepID=A0A438D911_VITVI|nr:Retrovirus-related Pol polyprotein from transposon RE2 [Vitis vinifera]
MAQFMHQPTDEHWTLVKRILRYLSGTVDDDLLLHCTSPLSLPALSDSIHAFLDADWVEYRSVVATAAELYWVCSFLSELCINLHVAVDYHFLHDQVQSGALCVAHVSSADQLVDLLTKPLPHSQFQKLRVKIGLVPPPMASKWFVSAMAILAFVLPVVAMATEFTVGDNQRWTINFDYEAWAKENISCWR